VEIHGTLSFAKEGDNTTLPFTEEDQEELFMSVKIRLFDPKDSDYPVEILRINQPGEK
jgi:hypothetical protein